MNLFPIIYHLCRQQMPFPDILKLRYVYTLYSTDLCIKIQISSTITIIFEIGPTRLLSVVVFESKWLHTCNDARIIKEISRNIVKYIKLYLFDVFFPENFTWFCLIVHGRMVETLFKFNIKYYTYFVAEISFHACGEFIKTHSDHEFSTYSFFLQKMYYEYKVLIMTILLQECLWKICCECCGLRMLWFI